MVDTRISIRLDDGSELEIDNGSGDGIVRTGLRSAAASAAEVTVVELGNLTSSVLDLAERFSTEATSRDLLDDSKLTVSFGITAGGEAGFKVANLKGSSFMTVKLELGPKGTN